MHMLAGVETLRDNRRMRVVDRQVDHGIDPVVGEQLRKRLVGLAAVGRGKIPGTLRLLVCCADQLDLFVGLERLGIRPGDIPTADHADA
jgi:hypothetical protein